MENVNPTMYDYLSVKEACTYLRITKPTLYKYMNDGTIPFTKLGSHTLIPRKKVCDMLNSNMSNA